MSNSHTMYDFVGNPEVPYESRFCPTCSAINWASGKISIVGSLCETDVILCWKCRSMFWIDRYGHESDLLVVETELSVGKYIVAEGVSDPSIPQNILQNLVDAAEQQLGEMKSVHAKHPHLDEDPELVKILNELSDSVEYVRDILYEGKLGARIQVKQNA